MYKTSNLTRFTMKVYSQTTNQTEHIVEFELKSAIKSLAEGTIIAYIIAYNYKEFVLDLKLF